MAGFFDDLGKDIRARYTKGRGELADFANRFGGAHNVMDPGNELHQDTSRSLTNALGTYFPFNPRTAAGIADLAGQGNELVAGGLQATLADKPFQSEAGYDYADIANNRLGQDKAIRDLEAAQSSRELTPRGLITSALRSMGGYDVAELGQKGLEKFSTTRPGQYLFGD